MSTSENIMDDAKLNRDHESHDERYDMDCPLCEGEHEAAAREFQPRRYEQVVTADADGYVRDWDFIIDEARGK